MDLKSDCLFHRQYLVIHQKEIKGEKSGIIDMNLKGCCIQSTAPILPSFIVLPQRTFTCRVRSDNSCQFHKWYDLLNYHNTPGGGDVFIYIDVTFSGQRYYWQTKIDPKTFLVNFTYETDRNYEFVQRRTRSLILLLCDVFKTPRDTLSWMKSEITKSIRCIVSPDIDYTVCLSYRAERRLRRTEERLSRSVDDYITLEFYGLSKPKQLIKVKVDGDIKIASIPALCPDPSFRKLKPNAVGEKRLSEPYSIIECICDVVKNCDLTSSSSVMGLFQGNSNMFEIDRNCRKINFALTELSSTLFNSTFDNTLDFSKMEEETDIQCPSSDTVITAKMLYPNSKKNCVMLLFSLDFSVVWIEY